MAGALAVNSFFDRRWFLLEMVMFLLYYYLYKHLYKKLFSMTVELFLEIGIGTRCRRIYEILSTDMDKIYRIEKLDMSVREFPIIYCLTERGSMSIAQIQKLTGLSHSAISQTVKKLAKKDLLALTTADDARSKIVSLTGKADNLIKRAKEVWKTAQLAMETVLKESDVDLLQAFANFEASLSRKSFTQRYRESQTARFLPEITIIPFDVKYRDDWRRINQEWIEKLFKMEEADIIALNNPEKYVLAKGGEIYFALLNGKPIGAVALKLDHEQRYELSKMGVLPEARGLGIGNKLVQKVIDRYKARGGKELFLETNSSLHPAINLYKKMGFKEVPPPENTPYARADYFMEFQNE
jgi:ribosomal protein S18 acetylase RimI-like enzyme/predicted transcriptional regulator